MAAIKEVRTAIDAGLDRLQAKADSRDTFNATKKEIQRAIAEFNAELDATDAAEERGMAAESDVFIIAYVEQAAALEADFGAIEESYDKQ